jgi:hypothetical protein
VTEIEDFFSVTPWGAKIRQDVLSECHQTLHIKKKSNIVSFFRAQALKLFLAFDSMLIWWYFMKTTFCRYNNLFRPQRSLHVTEGTGTRLHKGKHSMVEKPGLGLKADAFQEVRSNMKNVSSNRKKGTTKFKRV